MAAIASSRSSAPEMKSEDTPETSITQMLILHTIAYNGVFRSITFCSASRVLKLGTPYDPPSTYFPLVLVPFHPSLCFNNVTNEMSCIIIVCVTLTFTYPVAKS